MDPAVTVISSMATKHLLADLTPRYEQRTGQRVSVISVGGVEAAQRIEAGAPLDAAVLSADAVRKLIEAGHVHADSRVDLARSGVAVAVRAGAPRLDITREQALREAVLGASSIGYSTGPSGVYLAQLFERWGIGDAVRARIVVAPPGVAVGSLVADGRVALGFQQLSELIHVAGIDVLGPLPAAVQTITTFSGGIVTRCPRPQAARELLAFLAAPETAAAKQAQGMEAA